MAVRERGDPVGRQASKPSYQALVAAHFTDCLCELRERHDVAVDIPARDKRAQERAGVIGRNGFCGLDASLEIVLLRSCMDLGPKKHRIIKPNDEKSLALIRDARRRELP